MEVDYSILAVESVDLVAKGINFSCRYLLVSHSEVDSLFPKGRRLRLCAQQLQGKLIFPGIIPMQQTFRLIPLFVKKSGVF